MARLWADEAAKTTYSKTRRQLNLTDEGCKFFLEKIPTIFDPFYVPTDQDIMHCRVQVM